MERQENFKALIRSLRIKRHEKLKISNPDFVIKEGKGSEEGGVRSESDLDPRRE